MQFTATPLAGAFVIDLDRHEDERGAFARTFCAREFSEHALDTTVVQSSMSWNIRRGTLRGMHYQAAPHEEAKTVRAIAGSIFDVIVDLRDASATRGRWFGTELSAANGRALHIPKGFAHGFLTVEDRTVVHYDISAYYEPGAGRGFRFDDPEIAIMWPFAPIVISERDRNLPGWRA
jgi:dTDP-4-dehydrorhamnose 3,5-epimerase